VASIQITKCKRALYHNTNFMTISINSLEISFVGLVDASGMTRNNITKNLSQVIFLNPLKVDPALVPFDFSSQYDVLREKKIMVDNMGISANDLEISLCSSCHHGLADSKKTPRDSLANYQWIGNIYPRGTPRFKLD